MAQLDMDRKQIATARPVWMGSGQPRAVTTKARWWVGVRESFDGHDHNKTLTKYVLQTFKPECPHGMVRADGNTDRVTLLRSGVSTEYGSRVHSSWV